MRLSILTPALVLSSRAALIPCYRLTFIRLSRSFRYVQAAWGLLMRSSDLRLNSGFGFHFEQLLAGQHVLLLGYIYLIRPHHLMS